MSVDTHPTRHGDRTRVPAAAPTRGPVGRIVAGSLAVGLAAALVLTLVVFAGATESVVTGSMLLALGVGWALMAILTVRLTNRPMRWTVVPAALMGASGLALVVLAPGYAALTVLGWIWPPVALALAVWMFLHLHRSSSGVARWLLTGVTAVLALAAVGAAFEDVALAHDERTRPAPGRMYDVAGHRLHLDCRGHGGPTVVLFNGMGEISASWARISGPLAETTRVCAYDRAGQGWSEDAEHPQDGVAAAEDLYALLAAAGEPGPYVLVGHSTGGTYAMTYAARHPDQVAGLVLLDSSSPHQLTRIPAYSGQYAVMRRGLALLPTLARLGLARIGTVADLPEPAADQVRALTSTARAARNLRDEVSVVPEVFTQAQALRTLHGRPLAVLTASESLDGAGWRSAQDELAALSPDHVHRTVRASHAGLVEDRAPAAESARAITEIVHSVRTGAAVDPS